MRARSGGGSLCRSSTLLTVEESARSPACTCSIQRRLSPSRPDSASSPANSSRLPSGLRISCASRADISTSARWRRRFSVSRSSCLAALTSRRMNTELAFSALRSSQAWRIATQVVAFSLLFVASAVEGSSSSRSSPGVRAASSAAASAGGNASRWRSCHPPGARPRDSEPRSRVPPSITRHPARQAFENAAQTFPHAAVLFQADRQVAVGDFEFLTQMSDLPVQLSVGALQRTGRFGE